MMLLALSLAIGFLAVFIGTPYAERYLLASGMFGTDQQKEDKPTLATSGGVAVFFGFLFSVTTYLGFSSLADSGTNFPEVLAALSSVSIITLIGLLDDIHVNIKLIFEEELNISRDEITFEYEERFEKQLPHQKAAGVFAGLFTEKSRKDGEEDMIRQGMSQVSKMLFVIPAVFPLMAVGAGSWSMSFPVIGTVNWGLIYPLVLLPLGLLFVSNVVNMLAGMNGLSTSMSLVASTTLGIYALHLNQIEAAVIALSLSVALAGFLRYNLYPASVLPGDSLTYLCGAAMFSAIVIGDMEKFGAFIFLPWIIEFFLKARSGFNAHSWGDLNEKGVLENQHDKIYSLTHLLMDRKYDEKQITLILTGIETLICVTALILFTGVIK